MATLYFDCFSGASGDMILGALLDLGLPLDGLRDALGSLAIEYGEVTAERVTGRACRRRSSGSSSRTADAVSRRRAQAPSSEAHRRGHPTIVAVRQGPGSRRLICSSGWPKPKPHSRHTNRARAPARGRRARLDHRYRRRRLRFRVVRRQRLVASPLNVGGGTVRARTASFPCPRPATARLLTGTPVTDGTMELVTPTGALLMTGYAREFGPLPAMRIDRIGYGAGDGIRRTRRMCCASSVASARTPRGEAVVQIECEIDDMNPQLFGPLMDRLAEAGALDVFYAACR